MAGPFTTPVADSIPLDPDPTRNTIPQEFLQEFLDRLCSPDMSQKPIYRSDGELGSNEYYKGPVQTIANRIAKVDITYDARLNPISEVWYQYDPNDGTTSLRTVTFTHTWVNDELVKTETVTV